jgi:hypothetical protein
MTQPNDPTPGAPADDTTPQFTRTVTPPPAPPVPAQPTAPAPPWEKNGEPFDPQRAWTLIEKLRAENDKLKDPATTSRAAARAAAEAAEEARREAYAELGRSWGLVDDDDVDPTVLTERVETAQAQAWKAGVELAVYRGAATHGADPHALLDSMSFITSLDDLVDETPGTPEFDAALAKAIAAAVEANPDKYKAAQAAASSPGQAPGQPRPDPSQGARAPAAQRAQSLSAAITAHYAAKR